jgi:ribosomal protein S18 acetylase RimI-like enzyme
VAEIRIEVIEQADPSTTQTLAALLSQVSPRAAPLTDARLKIVLSTPATRVIAVRSDGVVVGMALLLICTTLTGRFGYVEEVAVDQSVRGQHLGIRLMVGLLELAAALGLDFVELTSRPSREVANGLYRSLGFVHRKTNVYRHELVTLPEAR